MNEPITHYVLTLGLNGKSHRPVGVYADKEAARKKAVELQGATEYDIRMYGFRMDTYGGVQMYGWED